MEFSQIGQMGIAGLEANIRLIVMIYKAFKRSWVVIMHWLGYVIRLYKTKLQWRHNERDASQITDVLIACPTVCSGAKQRKHQSSTSLAFVRGIHRWPVDSPHKGPVTRKMFPFDDVIMVM